MNVHHIFHAHYLQQQYQLAIQHKLHPTVQRIQQIHQVALQQEIQPGIQHDIRPGLQQEIQQVIQQEIQQEIQHEIQQEIQQEIQHEIQPGIQQEIQPVIQQEIQPGIQQTVHLFILPHIQQFHHLHSQRRVRRRRLFLRRDQQTVPPHLQLLFMNVIGGQQRKISQDILLEFVNRFIVKLNHRNRVNVIMVI